MHRVAPFSRRMSGSLGEAPEGATQQPCVTPQEQEAHWPPRGEARGCGWPIPLPLPPLGDNHLPTLPGVTWLCPEMDAYSGHLGRTQELALLFLLCALDTDVITGAVVATTSPRGFIYLKGRVKGGGGHHAGVLSGSLPKWLQQPGLGQAEAGSFTWVSHVGAGAKHLGHPLLLSQAH